MDCFESTQNLDRYSQNSLRGKAQILSFQKRSNVVAPSFTSSFHFKIFDRNQRKIQNFRNVWAITLLEVSQRFYLLQENWFVTNKFNDKILLWVLQTLTKVNFSMSSLCYEIQHFELLIKNCVNKAIIWVKLTIDYLSLHFATLF